MAVALLSRKCLPEATELILCAFENLQNATVSFVLSAWNKWPSAGRIFARFWARGFD
jgi:hypothetical protein